MKLWPYILLAIVILLAVFWALAVATGILQEILGLFAIVLALAATGGGIVLWIRRGKRNAESAERKTERQTERAANRELKQMEKKLRTPGREKAS